MNYPQENDFRPLMYKPEQAWALLNMSRCLFYDLVKSGAIELVKVGRSSFVTAEALNRFVKSLPASTADDRAASAPKARNRAA